MREGSRLAKREPLFILAPPRSFTSLVSTLLGQHPRMYGFPELNLFMAETMDEFWRGTDSDGGRKSTFWPVMRHGLLRTVAQLYAGEQTIDSVAMAYRWIRVRARRTTHEVFQELLAKIDPLIAIEKSPAYLRKGLYLDRLLEAYPNARFLHLLRHPRAQCESVLKARGGKLMLMMLNAIDYSAPYPVIEPQILWYEANTRIMAFLDRVPQSQWLRVKGEEILREPDVELAAICRWLGLPSGAAELAAMKMPELSPYAHVGPVTARLGNDINFLLEPRLRPARLPEYAFTEALPWRPDGRGYEGTLSTRPFESSRDGRSG
ncbi:MAG: sulfotransferase [Candidatus Competibacteraceae bacterium]|nr:sulfotransferase [Candidatus Competibacteraceae bacterium]